MSLGRHAPAEALRVGIVGCGNISGIYLRNVPAYRGLALRACADLRPEAAEAQARSAGIEAMTVDALLANPEIDLVVNLTVPRAHGEVSLAALRAGKHVFSEKPLAVEFAEGRRLVGEAEARGLLLGCAPDTFLGAAGRLARRLVDEGAVGRILSGTAFFLSHGMEHLRPDPDYFFKPGGGPVLDVGPYYLGALVNLLGPVRRVMSLGGRGFAERVVTADGPRKGSRIAVETPTHAMALLEFAAGAQVMLGLSWDVWRHGHRPIELYGTEGSLGVPDPDFFGGPVEIAERRGDWRRLDTDRMPLGIPNWRHPAWGPERAPWANYRGIGLAELASAARRGTPHRASGRFALHVLEVMTAIVAGAGGEPVSIETAPERPAALTDAEAANLWQGTPGAAAP